MQSEGFQEVHSALELLPGILIYKNIPKPVFFADKEILYTEKDINSRDDISQSNIEMKYR